MNVETKTMEKMRQYDIRRGMTCSQMEKKGGQAVIYDFGSENQRILDSVE